MTGTPFAVNHCHCSRCRKVRGTAHATNFCKVCGSSMPRFDQGQRHIWVGSKAPWHDITDGLPQFAEAST